MLEVGFAHQGPLFHILIAKPECSKNLLGGMQYSQSHVQLKLAPKFSLDFLIPIQISKKYPNKHVQSEIRVNFLF